MPIGAVRVKTFGMAQPAPSSGASGVVTVTGMVSDPSTGIAIAAAESQATGGPPTHNQAPGKADKLAVPGISSVKLRGPRNGEGPSLMISTS